MVSKVVSLLAPLAALGITALAPSEALAREDVSAAESSSAAHSQKATTRGHGHAAPSKKSAKHAAKSGVAHVDKVDKADKVDKGDKVDKAERIERAADKHRSSEPPPRQSTTPLPTLAAAHNAPLASPIATKMDDKPH